MNDNMQKYLEKAEVLIEALPYIQRFNRKIIVVKYGGSAMVDEELKRHVIEDVTLLKLCGFKPIIVHGGGKEISKWVGKVGKEPQFINGLRVTDEETMEIAEMVLGRVNKSCAIILEPLQGEGGINLATQEFMEGIRKICDENGILMICDEVQCGMGRTGSMFAWQGFGVKPDILTMAKAIGNGIPVGAFAMTEEVAKYSLQPGDHGATYGGNPLACTAVKTVIKIFERDHIVDHVNAVAPYLTKRLDELVEELDCVTERKGKGLMQGIVVTKPLAEVNKRAIEEGILIIQAQGNVIRFVPPLIVEEKHIDEMIEKLKRALA